jgi:hypothetical protein
MRPPTRFATGEVHSIREFAIFIQNPFEQLTQLSEEIVVRTWKNRWNNDGLQVEPEAVDWTLDMGLLQEVPVDGGKCGGLSVQVPWGPDFERFSLGYQKRDQPETYVSIVENIREEFLSEGENGFRRMFFGPEGTAAPEGSIRFSTPFAGKGKWHVARPFRNFKHLPAVYLWRCEIPALFEMHSHVQSNHCAPFPAAWLHAWDNFVEFHPLQPGYWLQDGVLKLMKGEMAEISTLPTPDIIDTFGKQFGNARYEDAFPFLMNAPDQVACLLPMDMEYMHFDGYFGIPVSKEVECIRSSTGAFEKVRWYCWNKIWGFGSNITYSTAPGVPVIGPTSEFRDPPSSQRGESWSWMDSKDGKTFETWPDQSRQYASLSKTALDPTDNRRIFPFQHFDPRRYTSQVQASSLGMKSKFIGRNGLESVLQDPIQVAPSGSFFGYKLYTTLGWAPMDPFLRDPLERFYTHCQALQIPLINHGTPAGFYTHDRRYYLDLLLEHDKQTHDHKVVEGSVDAMENGWMTGFSRDVEGPDGESCHPLSRQEGKDLGSGEFYKPDPACSWWYIQHYVSPRAWKKVVEKFPRLKLDLAHYGDSDHFRFKSWDKRKDREPKSMEFKHLRIAFDGDMVDPHRTHRFLYDLIDLIQPDNQVFADLSYVILDPHNAGAFADLFEWAREHKPILLERVLWGTDWPLVGDEPMVKPTHGGNMLHRYARGFHKALPSLPADFFIRACFLNPLQFLDLASIRTRIKSRKKDLDPWPWIQDLDPKLFQMDATNPELQNLDKAKLFYETHKGILGKEGV